MCAHGSQSASCRAEGRVLFFREDPSGEETASSTPSLLRALAPSCHAPLPAPALRGDAWPEQERAELASGGEGVPGASADLSWAELGTASGMKSH